MRRNSKTRRPSAVSFASIISFKSTVCICLKYIDFIIDINNIIIVLYINLYFIQCITVDFLAYELKLIQIYSTTTNNENNIVISIIMLVIILKTNIR